MPFEIEKGGKNVSLILRDSIDISEAGELLAALKGSIGSDIEVDMKQVSYIDASIIQILIAAKLVLKKEGKNLNILNKSEEAERIIKLSGAVLVFA